LASRICPIASWLSRMPLVWPAVERANGVAPRVEGINRLFLGVIVAWDALG
jgi:hypothetical protein